MYFVSFEFLVLLLDERAEFFNDLDSVEAGHLEVKKHQLDRSYLRYFLAPLGVSFNLENTFLNQAFSFQKQV